MAWFGLGGFGLGSVSTSGNMNRNDLITLAYRKIGIPITDTLMARGVDMLNLIIREEDAKQTGNNKSLWALYSAGLFLSANGFIYSINEGLALSVVELEHAVYRDLNGQDTTLKIVDIQGYNELLNKKDSGEPQQIYLTQELNLQSRSLYVHPALTDVGPTSLVIGSDTGNYGCILSHTAAAENKPITGPSWKIYWTSVSNTGTAWVSGSNYTHGQLIKYVYKRALSDFDDADDTPDMPKAWTRYLVYRLAHDLCPEQDIDMESRTWLRNEYMIAYGDLFNSAAPATNNYHNKVVYF